MSYLLILLEATRHMEPKMHQVYIMSEDLYKSLSNVAGFQARNGYTYKECIRRTLLCVAEGRHHPPFPEVENILNDEWKNWQNDVLSTKDPQSLFKMMKGMGIEVCHDFETFET